MVSFCAFENTFFFGCAERIKNLCFDEIYSTDWIHIRESEMNRKRTFTTSFGHRILRGDFSINSATLLNKRTQHTINCHLNDKHECDCEMNGWLFSKRFDNRMLYVKCLVQTVADLIFFMLTPQPYVGLVCYAYDQRRGDST